VSGQVNAHGMVCDLPELDGFVVREVIERYDHVNLNFLPEFAAKVPTTENLGLEIYERLRRFPAAHVERVRLEETRKNSFEIGNIHP
jgi:6-pyruvoyl-tetrahydropterin synthase